MVGVWPKSIYDPDPPSHWYCFWYGLRIIRACVAAGPPEIGLWGRFVLGFGVAWGLWRNRKDLG